MTRPAPCSSSRKGSTSIRRTSTSSSSSAASRSRRARKSTTRPRTDNEDGGAVSPEAANYYRQAIDAYKKVFAAKGADTPVGELRSIIAAHIQLGELDEAITRGRPGAARRTRRRTPSGRCTPTRCSAPASSTRPSRRSTMPARSIPSNTAYSLRKGKWLVEAGRVDEAVGDAEERRDRRSPAGGDRGADDLRRRLREGRAEEQLRLRHQADRRGEADARTSAPR